MMLSFSDSEQCRIGVLNKARSIDGSDGPATCSSNGWTQLNVDVLQVG